MARGFLVLGGLCAALLAAGGCAASSPVLSAAGPEECREIVLPGQEAASNICGSPEQFAELERRLAAASNPDLVCRERLVRNSNTLDTFCATEAEWAAFERSEAVSAQSRVWDFQAGSYNTGR